MSNTYEIDTLVQLTSNFTLGDGVTPIDPTTVTLYIKDPGDNETVVPGDLLTHVSTGVFGYDVNVNVSGWWTYKFQGAGNIEVTSPDTRFLVNASILIPG